MRTTINIDIRCHIPQLFISAIRIYRQLGDISLVWALEDVATIEDRNLLSGHLATFMENFDSAEQFYLDSSRPIEALDVRYDRECDE